MESSSSRRPLPINHWNVSNALTTSGWSSGRARKTRIFCLFVRPEMWTCPGGAISNAALSRA